MQVLKPINPTFLYFGKRRSVTVEIRKQYKEYLLAVEGNASYTVFKEIAYELDSIVKAGYFDWFLADMLSGKQERRETWRQVVERYWKELIKIDTPEKETMLSISEQIEANRKAGRTDNGYANFETESVVLTAMNDSDLYFYFLGYPKAVPGTVKVKQHILAFAKRNRDMFEGCDLRRVHWSEVRKELVEARQEEERFNVTEGKKANV